MILDKFILIFLFFYNLFCRNRLPKAIFEHKSFSTNAGEAMTYALDTIEKALKADSSIDTEFSGSTAVLATIQGEDYFFK